MLFRDVPARRTYRVTNDGKVADDFRIGGEGRGMAFGPDGRLYVADTANARILAYDAARRSTVVASGIRGRYLSVTPQWKRVRH
ncbi:MAG TPA: hypothetical protein VES67_22080 [Vicinamibacterales bacterium]|nr:hypothetical protein [Vicinamibacterales bacterium]